MISLCRRSVVPCVVPNPNPPGSRDKTWHRSQQEEAMSVFADRLLLQFADNSFVQELLTNQLGLVALFNLTYAVEDIDLRQIALAGVPRRVFEVPAFETIRTSGTDEKIMPKTERVRIERVQPRYGRLAWVDVLLDVLVSTQVESKAMPIERINTQNLLDKLGD